MKLTHFITFTASVCAVLSGCAAHTPFPPEVMEKVVPTFQFEAWRDAGPTNESGKSDSGIRVLLGGRIVIGETTTSSRPVLVNGIPKTEHFLIADCIHVWQTGGLEIAEFKEDAGGGYSPLPEKTYCAA